MPNDPIQALRTDSQQVTSEASRLSRLEGRRVDHLGFAVKTARLADVVWSSERDTKENAMPTEKKSEPTPRPWRIGKSRATIIRGPDDSFVGDICGCGTYPTDESNAALICRAVNAFDDLVAACELCLSELKSPGGATTGELIRSLKAALDKAKEGVDA